jgi:5,10-methylenetetrahydromethanopterin reductase
MVKFGLEFVPRDLFWKTTYYAIQAEKGLFDYLWITDHFTNRNVYVALSMILAYTDRIIVGTGVTNPYLVNPVVTAGAIASLNEIAPSRVVCGIGVGDRTTLEQAGVQAVKPLLAVKESVQIIRAMTTGGELTNFQGEIFKVPGARLSFRVRNPIPIYVGAQGRKMLNLAAEIGDGVLINASHPKDLREAIEHIKDGISKVGKPLDTLDIAAYSSFSVHEEAKKAFKAAVPVVAFIVAGSPDAVLEKHEIDRETGAKIRNFLIKGSLGEAFALVTPEMVDAFAVSGTPEECIEKISTIVKLGVTQFVAGSPIGSNVRKSISILTAKIIPHFKEM